MTWTKWRNQPSRRRRNDRPSDAGRHDRSSVLLALTGAVVSGPDELVALPWLGCGWQPMAFDPGHLLPRVAPLGSDHVVQPGRRGWLSGLADAALRWHYGLPFVRGGGSGGLSKGPPAHLHYLCPNIVVRYRTEVLDPWLSIPGHLFEVCKNFLHGRHQPHPHGTTDVREASGGASRCRQGAICGRRPYDGSDDSRCAALLPEQHGACRSVATYCTGKAERSSSAEYISRPLSRWLYRQTYSFTYPCNHLGDTA